MPCFSPLKGYKDPNTGGIMFRRPSVANPEPMDVACYQCLGCRRDRQRHWAIRILLHSLQFDQNIFVTLTYRDEWRCNDEQRRNGWFLPRDGSVNLAHFQGFMKRLRKKFPERKISYFHCGEYGEENFRPHYHACIFNLEMPDRVLYKNTATGPLWRSDLLDSLWRYGYCAYGDVEFNSAAYCASYTLKKVTGLIAEDYYRRIDLDDGHVYWIEPEYATMSNGLAESWLKEYLGDVFPSDEVPVPGKGVLKGVPRYFTEKLKEFDESLHEQVKMARQDFINEHCEDFTAYRLLDKGVVAKARQRFYEEKRATADSLERFSVYG